ncbi:PREDICTED: HAUS augmin-like complex subunit 6 isoform X2 [Ficedula albicollis]|uniref:HAUS augmin-like complex subunit 6 isoform X2 n=1 Tax=Ficedula albicollis TaxID=59894 RepID=UPI0007AD832F|nr:PREDICTED: HAUS augmin-like complex subunit 6 isoform X2 [Ficedula albicollis]
MAAAAVVPASRPAGPGAAKWESDHFWLCLLALGFNPKCHEGVRLGRDMFAKPNGRGFAVVVRFLFTKLDKHRARQVFEQSGWRKLPSPRFRKHCWMWLREIAQKEIDLDLPRITPSALICPGGAKFVHMIYCLARYVVIEEMKKLSVGTGIPFAEAIVRRPKDLYMAKARHRVAYNKLLQTLQQKDFVLQEYRRRAGILKREIQQTKAECEAAQEQLARMNQNGQNKNDTAEKIQKVRSMWALIVEALTSLRREKEVVDSVLADCANPRVLDGTDVVLSVPALLTHTVESNKYGFCTGNLYEGGKLNFLTVIQLLNEALMTLRDEHCPCELKTLHRIEDLVTSYKNVLHSCKSLCRTQQHCEPNVQSVSREQETWESKWKTVLGQCPSNLIFQDGLQPLEASSLQSFSSSDEDEHPVFCQSFSDNDDSCHEECHGKNDGALEAMKDTGLIPSKSCFLSPSLRCSSVESSSEAPGNGDSLIVNNLHTCVGNKKAVPPKILRNGKEEFPTSEMENAGENVLQPESTMQKDDLLEKARDELVEEIARSVCESSDSGEEKGMALEDLVSSLRFNPFVTRKQIPRTPENLLTEIRSSWRKALQPEGSLDLELSAAEVVTEESSVNAVPGVQEELHSTCVCSEDGSPVSDVGPPVAEKKSQFSSTESSSQEQVSTNHTFESSDSKTSGIQESERTDSEELGCSALSGSYVEDPSQTLQNLEKSMNIADACLKSDSRTNAQPSEDCGSSLVDEMLCQNASALNSVSHGTADVGIWNETLPECDTDCSTSACSDSFFRMDSEKSMDDSGNDEDIKKMDLDLPSLSNLCEVLKNTASESEEELCQTHHRDKCERAELSTIPEEVEEADADPLIDEGFPKVPLPNSPHESKYSPSPLPVSFQQMDGE